MKKTLLISTLFFAMATGIATAQSGTPGINGRQVNQHERINQGVQSGELTRAEYRRLKNEQRRIGIEKKMAKSDGVVTPAERRFLRHEQRKANRHIHRQKNDAQERR